MTQTTGERVKAQRLALGLSLRQLSEASGVHRTTITKVEADDPSVEEYTTARVLMALEQMSRTGVVEEHIYEKCRDCHLFVEPNGDPSPSVLEVGEKGIAPYMHLARGNAADEKLDGDHEPVPSGMKANLNTWRVFGPVAMRERFVTPDEWANY